MRPGVRAFELRDAAGISSLWSRARVEIVALGFTIHQVFSTQESRHGRVPGDGSYCAQRAGCLVVVMNHLKRSKQNKTKPETKTKSKSRVGGIGDWGWEGHLP